MGKECCRRSKNLLGHYFSDTSASGSSLRICERRAIDMLVTLRRVREILLIAVGCFFLLFGVQLLISAYQLNNPFWFVMTFFASNLIILISIALVVGFIIRMIKPLEKGEDAVPTSKGREG
jgi:hypothetical protein